MLSIVDIILIALVSMLGLDFIAFVVVYSLLISKQLKENRREMQKRFKNNKR